MRIIGGEFRSRRLKGVPGRDVRPTPDRLREALFSVLAPRIEGVVFVDLYAGCGTVGLEALSRGAKRACFVENDSRALAVLRENIASLGVGTRSVVHQGRAAGSAGRWRADVVFLDPPYTRPHEYLSCLLALAEDPPPLVIAQHSRHQSLEDFYASLNRTRVLKQGDNQLSFYEPAPKA